VLVALLLPAVQSARESARRTQCITQLRELGQAAIAFQVSKKRFPGWQEIVARDAGFDGEAVYLAEGVTFGVDTTQLSVPVGNYDAYVSLAGAGAPAISVEGVLDFAGGEVLDIIARDGEAGPELLVLDYSDEGNVAACPAPAAL